MIILLAIFAAYTALGSGCVPQSHPKASLVVPAIHKALDWITNGVQNSWRNSTGGSVSTYNANGELAVMTSILTQLTSEKPEANAGPSFLMCIGTGLLEMTMKMSEQKLSQGEELGYYIIGVAASLDNMDMNKACGPSKEVLDKTFVISDEIPPQLIMQTVRKSLPEAQAVTLVVSNTEKVLREVEEMRLEAQNVGLNLQVIYVDNAMQMFTQLTSETIHTDSRALLILKDHLMVSCVPYLLKVANERGLILFSCDEGSVAEGVHIGVGVSEEKIGVIASEVAYAISQGNFDTTCHTVPLKDLSTFVNKAWYEKTKSTCGPLAQVCTNIGSPQDLEFR